MHAPRAFAIPAKRVEVRCPAHGAQVRRIETRGRYSGLVELAAVLRSEIDVHAARAAELLGHLGPDFETAVTDSGSDRRVQILGQGSETRAHGIDGVLRDPRRRAAPSRMDGSDRTIRFIDEQQRDAIGSLDGDYRPRDVFEQGVALAENSGAPFGRHAIGGMNLLQGGETLENRGDIRVARAETVYEPREGLEFGYAIDGIRVEVKRH
jgi:hypothetical protein